MPESALTSMPFWRVSSVRWVTARDRVGGGRGTVGVGGGGLDLLGLVLLVLGWLPRRLRVRDLRQPRVEARDRVVQLLGDALLAAGGGVVAWHVAARHIVAQSIV